MRRAVEAVSALVALALTAPVLLVVALMVKATSPGPVFHRAARVGRDGTRFEMLKFRTMVDGAAARGPALTTDGDPRITRVGRWLRRVHLDELPQLWNVLRGDMGFVGPRPEDPRFVDLGDPRWERVLEVRPGITGPTQLAFHRREAELLCGEGDPEAGYLRRVLPRKLEMDAGYVGSRTVLGDLGVLVRTAGSLIGART